MADVAMPRLSDSMEEGTILKWLKSDGDEIQRGDELVEIETDKANMTYESDLAGVLKIVAQEGDTLPVGDTIAQIGGNGGAPSADEDEDEDEEKEKEKGEAEPEQEDDKQPAEGGAGAADEEVERVKQPEPVATKEEQPEPEPAGGTDGRVKASPIARRMAKELGIDLAALQGSGPGGRIVKSDVEAAASDGGKADEEPAEEAPAEEPARGDEKKAPEPAVSGDGTSGRGETAIEELTRLQQTVARRMAESKATAPDFLLTSEVDMAEAVEFRKQLKAAAGDAPPPSFNDFVVKASALALKEFPRVNGAYRDGKFELYSRVNVGIAVAGQDTLIVPTIFDADRKSLGEIGRESRSLAERAREGQITPGELASGTFAISNLGMYGIKRFSAVINPPQAAILAVGEMTARPVVRDNEIVIRPILELTITCDHRILYGADAAEFLGRIRERLEQPLALVL
jgi:pyruvate dehydrogenase E2 component (dihydrolipoamide acetyltransferase)